MTSQNPENPSSRSYWITKFATSFLAAEAIVSTIGILLELLPAKYINQLDFVAMFFKVQVYACIALSMAYTIYWQFKEYGNQINSAKIYAWFHGLIRSWLAFAISTYGFAKILRTQFSVGYSPLDTPVSDLSGFSLTWIYFGYSHMFAVIIGLVQIGGSILLLFRRTTLLGTIVLLPVMVNIVLINLFYTIATGALINSVLFTTGLTLLLLVRWADLKLLFLKSVTDLPAIPSVTFKSVVRVLIIGCAFSIIYKYTTTMHSSALIGKWKVDRMIRNGDTVKANNWLVNATSWTTVYIERTGTLSLCPNPYRYDDNRSQSKKYVYDSVKHTIQLTENSQQMGLSNDTINVKVSKQGTNTMQWDWTINQSKITLQLLKVETKNFD